MWPEVVLTRGMTTPAKTELIPGNVDILIIRQISMLDNNNSSSVYYLKLLDIKESEFSLLCPMYICLKNPVPTPITDKYLKPFTTFSEQSTRSPAICQI